MAASGTGPSYESAGDSHTRQASERGAGHGGLATAGRSLCPNALQSLPDHQMQPRHTTEVTCVTESQLMVSDSHG